MDEMIIGTSTMPKNSHKYYADQANDLPPQETPHLKRGHKSSALK